MRRSRTMRLLIILAAGLFAVGCRTRLLVTDISETSYDPVIEGIPFRVRETHTIRVFQWLGPTTRQTTVNGKVGPVEIVAPAHFVEIMRKEVAFPNQRRLFALNFRSEQFADRDFKLHYFPDNTIRDVELTGTPKPEGMAQVLGSATGAAKTGLEAEENIAKRVKALQDAEKQRWTDEHSRVTDVTAYLENRDALRRHCAAWREWEDDPATQALAREAYLKQRTDKKFELDARALLKQAMLAAIKIGRTLYDGDPYHLTLEQICTLINSSSSG